MHLDRIDRKIVAALMADATMPVARLADSVGLSQTPCWKRVQKLRSAGVIRASVALVDPERLGLGLTAFVQVEAPEHSDDWHRRFANLCAAIPEVMDVYRTGGDADYILRLVVRDLADFERVSSRVAAAIPLRRFAPQFALERVKSVTVLPIDTETV